MKKQILIFGLLLIAAYNLTACRTAKEGVTITSIKDKLIDFLVSHGDITKHDEKKFRNDTYSIGVLGVQNNYRKEKLIDGVYALFPYTSHTKSYFLIIENNRYIILDNSTRPKLEKAIKQLLDFCERKKYCFEITNDYVARLIAGYYVINKNPMAREDMNCVHGIINAENLP